MLGNEEVLGCGSITSEQAGDRFWNLQRQSLDVRQELWQGGFFLVEEAIHLVEEVLWWTARELLSRCWAEDE